MPIAGGHGRWPPTGEQTRLMVKVARMYHERGRKQAAIAAELHITQARVSRLLRRAVDAGIVTTVVTSPADVHTGLEERLERRYGLVEAVVVEAHGDDERDVAATLGAAAAAYLESTLLGGETLGISSWSASLLATATRMRTASTPVADDVVQLVGGVGDPGVQVEANRLLTTFAAATGANPIFMPAPGLLGSSRVTRSLMADPTIAGVCSRWADLTTAVVGIGTLEPSQLLQRSGNAIADDDQAALRTLGAVGDVCYRFFDAEGTPTKSELDGRVIGIEPDRLRRVPRRIGIAGGERKGTALRGALLGRWVNVLITDTAAAQRLVEGPG